MKRKIGTIVDDDLYHEVKVLAARERRPIAEVVEVALNDYVQRAKRKHPLRTGLPRFLEAPGFDLTDEQFRESMELDFFDQ
jgi:predicted transcriptional regulator